MKKYAAGGLRNVAIVAHGGAGKTTLLEGMLYDAGATDRLGRVDDGTATSDYDPEEIRRKISLNATVVPCEWKDVKINVIDTPGYADFTGEVKAGLRVADSAVVVVCAASGVEVGTENVWKYASERQLPRLVFVSKLDRENANFYSVLQQLKNEFGAGLVAAQIPIGSEASFRGVVDLIRMKAILPADPTGRTVKEEEVPADLEPRLQELRAALVEAAVEHDDELLTKYLEGAELTPEEIASGLAAGVKSGKTIPVLCGSGLRNTGIQPLLDLIVAGLPSPLEAPPLVASIPGGTDTVERKADPGGPLAALVFKTTADPYVGKLTLFRVYSGTLKSDSQVYNAGKGRQERVGQLFLPKGKQQEPVPEVGAGDIGAVAKLVETGTGDTLCDRDAQVVAQPIEFPRPALSMSVQPKAKGDEDKISSGIARLLEEDPTLALEKQTETGEVLVSGLGELHLDVMAERLKRKFGVDVVLTTPKVPYRETVRRAVRAEGKHKKQTGGRGQYGHVFLEVEPLPEGTGFEFADKVFGGSVPRQYIPAVEKGVRETMVGGILAGYPLVDFRATLCDGSYHPVDSSELAFKIAASLALKKAVMDANPVLLEPIMNVQVMVPEAYMGDVIGDLNKKRGKILGMESAHGGYQVVRALAPLAELFKYSIDLRSMTQGRATYTTDYSHYEEVPAHIAQDIIEKAAKAKEQ